MAQLSQLLVFDSDPSGLDTLTYGFEKDGCSVVGTGNPDKARDLIQGAPPSLVVINLRDPDHTGLDLLRAITSNPRTRNLACVVIGREDSRAVALGAGAFVFLAVPLFVRDILSACRLVAAASVPGSRPSPDTELTLKVSDLDGIYFLVRALAVSGRSAVIEVRHGPTRGELRFIDGTLTSAQVGSIEGLPALHHMLLWADAELRFKFRNVVRRGTQLSMKSGEVIEECDRFLRDFVHEVQGLGVARTVYATNMGLVQPSSAFPSEVLPVLRLFDGGQGLGHVLDDSPFRVFDTLKIIKRFVEGEAISLATPLSVSPNEVASTISGPAALDLWLQRQSPALGPEVGGRAEVPVRGVTGGNAANGSPGRKASSAPSDAAGSGGGGAGAGSRAPSPEDGDDSGHGGLAASSPFVTVEGATGNSGDGHRKRTITRKKHVITSPGVTSAGEINVPPPPAHAADGVAKTTVSVAQGEINIAPPPVAQAETIAAVGAPSVLVELETLPAPAPLVPLVVAPVTAHAGSPSVHAGSPSVIVASMTPAPIATNHARSHTPPRGGAVVSNGVRPPAAGFNDVEADFFDREADLYKRESVESFDDLDRNPASGRPLAGSSRKR